MFFPHECLYTLTKQISQWCAEFLKYSFMLKTIRVSNFKIKGLTGKNVDMEFNCFGVEFCVGVYRNSVRSVTVRFSKNCPVIHPAERISYEDGIKSFVTVSHCHSIAARIISKCYTLPSENFVQAGFALPLRMPSTSLSKQKWIEKAAVNKNWEKERMSQNHDSAWAHSLTIIENKICSTKPSVDPGWIITNFSDILLEPCCCHLSFRFGMYALEDCFWKTSTTVMFLEFTAQ